MIINLDTDVCLVEDASFCCHGNWADEDDGNGKFRDRKCVVTGPTWIFPRAPMATCVGRITGLAYVPPI